MVKRCPQCQSENVTLYMGAHFGKWMCKECDYIGPLIMDEDENK